jgi:YVTN family beta-propeller protein
MLMRRILVALLFSVPASLFAQASPDTSKGPPERPCYRSPLDLVIDPVKPWAYVALHGADSLAVVDLQNGRVLSEIPVGRKPYDVAFYKGTVYVTCEADDILVAVDATGGKVKYRFKVGQAPRGLSIDPQTGGISVVCHDEKVLWVRQGEHVTPKKVPIPPQPEGNFARATNIELVKVGDKTQYQRAARPYGLFTYGESIRDKKASREEGPWRTAFDPVLDIDYSQTGMDLVVHTRARWSRPIADAENPRVFTNALSFFVKSADTAAVVLLDEPSRGYPDPTDVVVGLPVHVATQQVLKLEANGKADQHPLKGARMFISSGGADAVLVLDLHRAAKHFEFVNRVIPPPKNVGGFGGYGFGYGGPFGWQGGFKEDLGASRHYTLARLPTQANPRRMVLTPSGKTLMVSNHLADSLTLIDATALRVLGHISLGSPQPDPARRGEILFHSARYTFQQQFTCASCHPQGGADGLSWDTSPKGKGGHLNTRALHGVRDTSPFGWKGDSNTLVARVKKTMRGVHRYKIGEEDASDIAAYLETLEPLRPLPQQAKDLPAIARGKSLFFGKAECNRCHRGPALTSDSPRAVVENEEKKLMPFDVPSLRGVARTAPYLHDGRARTLGEIFETHNPQKQHGAAHLLTSTELRDLLLFLRSL